MIRIHKNDANYCNTFDKTMYFALHHRIDIDNHHYRKNIFHALQNTLDNEYCHFIDVTGVYISKDLKEFEFMLEGGTDLLWVKFQDTTYLNCIAEFRLIPQKLPLKPSLFNINTTYGKFGGSGRNMRKSEAIQVYDDYIKNGK